MKLEIASQVFELHAQKVLLWPKHDLLAVADAHFGKSTTFQNHGLWLPEEAEVRDIQRLESLIDQRGIRTVFFLGDFTHSSEDLSEAVESQLVGIHQKYPDVRFVLIVGNHDLHFLKRWPESLSFIERVEKVILDRIRFVHDIESDQKIADSDFTWYGHIHPVVKLTRGPELLRLPAFWLETHRGCLPAFSSLAGGSEISKKKNSRLFAVAAGNVFALD